MPVYNEDKYIASSIDSILNQDYSNIELIICDNASSDKTEEICRQYQKNDDRIQYYRNTHNIGAIANFQKSLNYANGKYFMFAGGHDKWSLNYISTNLIKLKNSPNSVLSYGATEWIDEEGLALNTQSAAYDTRGLDPVTRYLLSIWGGTWSPVYGLIRVESLRKVRLNTPTIGSDIIMLSELSLIGSFIYTENCCWFRRMTRPHETKSERIERYNSSLFRMTNVLSQFFPHIRLPFELIKSIIRSELTFIHKSCAIMLTLTTSPIKYFISNQDNK